MVLAGACRIPDPLPDLLSHWHPSGIIAVVLLVCRSQPLSSFALQLPSVSVVALERGPEAHHEDMFSRLQVHLLIMLYESLIFSSLQHVSAANQK